MAIVMAQAPALAVHRAAHPHRWRPARRPRGAARQALQRLVHRQPHGGRLHRNAEIRAAARIRHQHRDADQAGQELFAVERVAVAAHAGHFGFQLLVIGQRRWRAGLQRHMGQQPPALRLRHLCHEHLAAGRAMHRHARAGGQVETQRRRGLHPIEIQHFAAGQRGQVATLTEFVDQMPQHRMLRAVERVVQQQVLRESAQPQPRGVAAPIVLTLQQRSAFQLLQHAVQRRLRQPGLVHQRLQREQLVARRHHFEQRDESQGRRIAVHFGLLRRELRGLVMGRTLLSIQIAVHSVPKNVDLA